MLKFSFRAWISLVLIIFVCDQLSKWMASIYLSQRDYAVFPSINFTLSYNEGAAFGFLAKQSGWQRWFFIISSLLIFVTILIWQKLLTNHEQLQHVALALILGGGLGNISDRIYLGYVVDFIDIYYKNWHWYIFNVADIAISIGVLLLSVLNLHLKYFFDTK